MAQLCYVGGVMRATSITPQRVCVMSDTRGFGDVTWDGVMISSAARNHNHHRMSHRQNLSCHSLHPRAVSYGVARITFQRIVCYCKCGLFYLRHQLQQSYVVTNFVPPFNFLAGRDVILRMSTAVLFLLGILRHPIRRI